MGLSLSLGLWPPPPRFIGRSTPPRASHGAISLQPHLPALWWGKRGRLNRSGLIY